MAEANAHYRKANALGDAGQKEESIREYTKAVELFPLFFEAIDNRAFTYMELGDYAAALRDFEASLAVNPLGHKAFFARGECYLKSGAFEKAAQVFEECLHRFPEPEHRDFLLHHLKLARAQMPSQAHKEHQNPEGPAAAAAPWWKFWK